MMLSAYCYGVSNDTWLTHEPPSVSQHEFKT